MWTPDGEHITLNLNVRGGTKDLDIVQVLYDGTDLHSIYPVGSRHPSTHPTLPLMVTDAYTHEPLARGDGMVPLRMIDLRKKRRSRSRTSSRVAEKVRNSRLNSAATSIPHGTVPAATSCATACTR